MQPITEFDDQDPHVLAHRHEHLSERGGLLSLLAVKPDAVEFGNAVDERCHIGVELGLYVAQRHSGVFNRIVKKGRRDGLYVDSERSDDLGHRNRMGDVGLTALAPLRFVGGGGHLERFHDHLVISPPIWAGERLQNRFQRNLGQRPFPAPRQHPLDRHDHIHRLQQHSGPVAPRHW